MFSSLQNRGCYQSKELYFGQNTESIDTVKKRPSVPHRPRTFTHIRRDTLSLLGLTKKISEIDNIPELQKIKVKTMDAAHRREHKVGSEKVLAGIAHTEPDQDFINKNEFEAEKLRKKLPLVDSRIKELKSQHRQKSFCTHQKAIV